MGTLKPLLVPGAQCISKMLCEALPASRSLGQSLSLCRRPVSPGNPPWEARGRVPPSPVPSLLSLFWGAEDQGFVREPTTDLHLPADCLPPVGLRRKDPEVKELAVTHLLFAHVSTLPMVFVSDGVGVWKSKGRKRFFPPSSAFRSPLCSQRLISHNGMINHLVVLTKVTSSRTLTISVDSLGGDT